jgi:hypothetical protein
MKTYGRNYVLDYLVALLVTALVHWLTIDFCSSIVPAPIKFSYFVKACSRTAEKHKHFCAALEYVLAVHRNLSWSLDEVILEQYWKVLYSGFKAVSNNYYFSNIF